MDLHQAKCVQVKGGLHRVTSDVLVSRDVNGDVCCSYTCRWLFVHARECMLFVSIRSLC